MSTALMFGMLSNDAVKPSKLVRHLHLKYNNFKGKPLECFERLLYEMTTQKKQIKKKTSTNKSLRHASYHISFQIVKTKKPYTIGKELVKPCVLTAAKDILSPETAKKFEGIPLSNNTV